MYRWLEKKTWERFLRTYSMGVIQSLWDSVFIMCDLFQEVAKDVSQKMNFTYNQEEADNSLKFLEKVQMLPKGAKEIYS